MSVLEIYSRFGFVCFLLDTAEVAALRRNVEQLEHQVQLKSKVSFAVILPIGRFG